MKPGGAHQTQLCCITILKLKIMMLPNYKIMVNNEPNLKVSNFEAKQNTIP